jgi:hypothetical protein
MPDDTDPELPEDHLSPDGDETEALDTADLPTAPGLPADTAAGDEGDITQAVSIGESIAEPMAEPIAEPMAEPMGDETGPLPASDVPTQAVGGIASADDGTGDATAAPGPDAGAPAPQVSRRRGRRRRALDRRWMIVLATVAVLVLGSGIALAVTGKSNKGKPSGAPFIPASTIPLGAPCPLTGVRARGQVPQRPALAVKVDNYPEARPQSGLSHADIVFEEPVEGGITRLVAVFQCQSPALIGPIRSARAVDVQILDQLSKPVFIHAGGIDPVIALLSRGNLTDDNLFSHGSVIQNPSGRYAPYDTYVSASAAWGLDPSDKTPPAPVFSYSSTTPAGAAVTSLHIPFASTNDTRWTWDASSGQWQLSYSGTPATVADGGQITSTNIVVQTVHVTYGPWLENDVGGLEVQSQMTGSGPLTVFRNGIEVTGTWHRASVGDPTTLTATDGSPIALQPGTTWVEIVPSTVSVTVTHPTSSAPTSRP